jgi:hypothetical protein
MFIETKSVAKTFVRSSKLGKSHSYTRSNTIAIFQCDNCDLRFERKLGQMDNRRLSNNYFHVCSNCDAKKFAQQKGAEKRKIWKMSADDVDLDISKI